jgi:hypothetical protein
VIMGSRGATAFGSKTVGAADTRAASDAGMSSIRED